LDEPRMWNRAKTVLITLILVGASLTVYFSLYLKTYVPAGLPITERDTSWISKVNSLLEESKPYPDEYTKPPIIWFHIYLYENGTEQLVDAGEADNEFVVYLQDLLLRVDGQRNSSITQEFVNKVLATNKVLMLTERMYHDFHLWKNFGRALFVLEDNLNEDLEGIIIVRETIEGNWKWSRWEIAK
jgi:hypothetical protein